MQVHKNEMEHAMEDMKIIKKKEKNLRTKVKELILKQSGVHLRMEFWRLVKNIDLWERK